MQRFKNTLRCAVIALSCVTVLNFMSVEGFAQCSAPSGNSNSGCAGTYTMSATSSNSAVTSHRWYTAPSGGSAITPSNQFSPVSGIWVSQYTAYFSSTTTYYVAAVCGGTETTTRTAVTVTISNGGSLTITPSGSPTSVCQGSNFSLTANGGSSYEWRFNTSASELNSTYISSATTIYPAQLSYGSGYYILKGINSCNQQQSTMIPVTIVPPVGTPSVPSGPPSRCQGSGTSTYTSSVSNGSISWSITNAGSSTISNGTVTWDPNFTGTATVTAIGNGCGTSTSSSRSVVVNPTPASPMTATISGGSNCNGGNTSYTCSVSNASGTLTYQWKVNGNNVTNNNPNVPAYVYAPTTNLNDGDVVTCVVSTTTPCAVSPVTSNALTMDITPPVTPSVSLNFNSIYVCSGSPITFTAVPTNGGTSPSYRWTYRGSPVTNNTSNTFTTPNAYVSGDIVTVQMTSSLSCVTSSTSAVVSSGPIPFVIIPVQTPSLGMNAPAKGCVGTAVTFTANLQYGGNSPVYQWKVDGASAGTNSSTLDYTFTSAGNHTVELTASNIGNTSSYCVSSTASLTTSKIIPIYTYPTPAITTSGSTSFGQGEITLTSSTCTGCSYQWKYRLNTSSAWSNVGGAITNILVPGKTGYYTIDVNSNGCVASAPEAGPLTINENNYVIINTIKKSGVTSRSQITSLTVNDLNQKVLYLDGLGRTNQTIVTQGSKGKLDIVSFNVFDDLNRASKQYLPYTSGNTGSIKTGVTTAQASFYQTLKGDNKAFSETLFENSPLSRPIEKGEAGGTWQIGNKTSKLVYSKNAANEIRIWNYNSATKTATGTSYYAANTLSITEARDEAGLKTKSYANKDGKVICQAVQKVLNDENSYIYTYYIYDEFFNLRFVIPAEAVKNLPGISYSFTYNDSFCQRWLYAFEYDNLFRISEKSTPNGGITYIVYDPLNRPMLVQNATQRTQNQWLFSKFDVLDRNIMVGLYTHGSAKTQVEMQTIVDQYYSANPSLKYFESRSSADYANLHGYTNQSFPVLASPNTAASQPFKVNYFDDYDFDYNATAGELAKGEPVFVNAGGTFPVTGARSKGRITGSRVLVVGTSAYLTHAAFYDREGRVIQTQKQNYNTGSPTAEVQTFELDFEGKIIRQERRHLNVIGTSTATLIIKQRFVYDHAGRLLEQYVQPGTQPEERIALLSYNEAGEPIRKVLGSGTGLQGLDYKYNMRGWISDINATAETNPADYFRQTIYYDNQADAVNSPSTPRYDGLASAIKWKHDISTNDLLYAYDYNSLGYMKSADYKVNRNNTGWVSDLGMLSENNFTYDDNGNIKSLDRYTEGATTDKIDQLSFDYGTSGGNQLLKVSDSAPGSKALGFKDGLNTGNDYTYDVTGKLTRDENKGISQILYNHIDRPSRITLADGYITYTYDANGKKLVEEVFNNTNVSQKKIQYYEGITYVDGELQYILHDEGRLVPPSYTNLISNREANGLEGYTANQNVTLSSVSQNGETYVKVVSNQSSSTPGVYPIGGSIAVKPGERYAFKVLGYRETADNAYLYVRTNVANLVWPGALLPQGQNNENWVTSEFVVPAGVTSVNVGVLFSPPTIGATFYVNRVALYKLDMEYQYFVNDHLGSVHVVLQQNPATQKYTATMETENFTSEDEQFLNLSAANIYPHVSANSTLGGNEVIRMNNTYRVGPAKSFSVLPGDKIDASVWAYYETASNYNQTPVATMINSVVAVMAGGSAVITEGISTAFTNPDANPAILLEPNQGTARPSAFINYILFDSKYNPLEAKSTPVGTNAAVRHQLVLPSINVKEAGYLFVYLSYDNENTNWVYFDEFKINYVESPVIQINDYYPFGAVSNTWTRDGELLNEYQFQGKEYNAKLGWSDFHARQYDGMLGRWYVNDPKSFLRPYHSPYMAMGNNPITNVDPDGEFFLGTILTFVGDAFKTAFLDGGLDPTSSGARRDAWSDFDPTKQGTPTNNAWRIDKGQFQTDPNLNFGQRLWQLVSRFTWEQPLTTLGNWYAHSVNWTANVERVDYFAGATVLWNANKENSGTTIGSYINISSWRTDANGNRVDRRPGFLGLYNQDALFIHEFGHYVQAQHVSGPLTLLGGINSMLSTIIEEVFDVPNFHDDSWWEMDASQRGLDYFINTGRLDPSNPATNTWIQTTYLVQNPSDNGKWWEFLTLPATFWFYFQ